MEASTCPFLWVDFADTWPRLHGHPHPSSGDLQDAAPITVTAAKGLPCREEGVAMGSMPRDQLSYP